MNQLSATGLTYDASGNMLTDGLNTYGWNAESEIKSAAGVNYTYDGDGNRLQKSNGKIYWYGAGTEILDESDLSGNFTNEYVFFGGKRIAMRNVSTGTIYYYAEDMLGSSRTLVQAGQTSVCYDADFYPFGGERDIVTTCSQNYKFEGKERDTETNNDDFGARYYSSRFGRWLSADWSSVPAPVPYANLTNPQTLNLYAMVSDNPETFADLNGHDPADSPTTIKRDSTCGIDTCTTVSNAGTCSGLDCGSSNNAQQNSQTKQPEKKKSDKKKGCDQACHARRHADYLKLAADSAMLLAQLFPEGEEEAFNLEAAAAEAEVEAEAAEAQAEELAEAAADADHAGEGVRAGPKDRSGQGNVDQLEGVEHERATKTKQGGYRISPKKSQQNVDRTNRGGRPGQDIIDEYEGVI